MTLSVMHLVDPGSEVAACGLSRPCPPYMEGHDVTSVLSVVTCPACVSRVREDLSEVLRARDAQLEAEYVGTPPDGEEFVDWSLFGRLAAGPGGRRTGALIRTGLIEVKLTSLGEVWYDSLLNGCLPLPASLPRVR